MSRYLNLDAVERVDDAIPSTLREIEVDGQHEHRRGRHAPLWTDEFAVEEDDEGDADGDDGKDVVCDDVKRHTKGKREGGRLPQLGSPPLLWFATTFVVLGSSTRNFCLGGRRDGPRRQ